VSIESLSMSTDTPIPDKATANAFATSWNNLPVGSIYTKDQFEEWMEPITAHDIAGKRLLELGCGNASLMVHMTDWNPSYLEGVDLGDSILSAKKNLALVAFKNWMITQDDMVEFKSEGFDFVYCIGVLHHLKDPAKGFESVIRNTKPGGRFHCWVYAREGNSFIINFIDPIRKIASRLPWWFTKYCVATPLAVPFYFYAKLVAAMPKALVCKLPMHNYMLWIAKREFSFFRHVAFDQLVTPQTSYLAKSTLQQWLSSHAQIDPTSIYIKMRNGNSWKFGGKLK
jgi:SAM-dependent methyltransferase